VTDIHDISRHRAARETAKREAEDQAKAKRAIEDVEGKLSEALGSMNNNAFIAFVNHAESVIPQHSVLKAPWFQSNISSLLGVFIDQVRPDDIKKFFDLLVDWMHESYIAQTGGPPNYPPVLCESCGEDGPKEGV
jgi:hypothetical protein